MDREGTTILWKADKGLNSSQAQTWTKSSTAVLLQLPAFVAGEKKTYKEGTNSNEKGYPLRSALFVLQNIPLHKRVNKDAADFPFLLGEGPALSNNLIIRHSLQGKQSGPWKEEQTNEKLSAGQPKDNL